MNTSSKTVQEAAFECCKLANQRYGLSRGMQMLMRNLNMNNNAKNHIVELAKNREFKELEDIISRIGIIGGDKPRHVRIEK